jgi:hypothetical protein
VIQFHVNRKIRQFGHFWGSKMHVFLPMTQMIIQQAKKVYQLFDMFFSIDRANFSSKFHQNGRGMHDPGQLLLARADASQQQREHAAAIERSERGDGGDSMLRGGKRF